MGLQHVTNQSAETVHAYKLARDVNSRDPQQAEFNPFEESTGGGGALGGGGGGGVPRGDYDNNATANGFYDSANSIENNLRFIATTAVGRGLTNILLWSSLVVPKPCR